MCFLLQIGAHAPILSLEIENDNRNRRSSSPDPADSEVEAVRGQESGAVLLTGDLGQGSGTASVSGIGAASRPRRSGKDRTKTAETTRAAAAKQVAAR